jgi:hypothetical protein
MQSNLDQQNIPFGPELFSDNKYQPYQYSQDPLNYEPNPIYGQQSTSSDSSTYQQPATRFSTAESPAKVDPDERYNPDPDDPVMQSIKDIRQTLSSIGLKQKLNLLKEKVRSSEKGSVQYQEISILKSAADGVKDIYKIESRKSEKNRDSDYMEELKRLEKKIRKLEKYIIRNTSENQWEDIHIRRLKEIKEGLGKLRNSRSNISSLKEFLEGV